MQVEEPRLLCAGEGEEEAWKRGAVIELVNLNSSSSSSAAAGGGGERGDG